MLSRASSSDSLHLERWNVCGGSCTLEDLMVVTRRFMPLQYRMVEGLVDHGPLLHRFNSASNSSDQDSGGGE
jgi:hypothetical protein